MLIHTCKKCEFSTKYKSVYDKHLLSKTHYKVVSNTSTYTCKYCNINCKQKRDYDNHLLTIKHKRNTISVDNSGNNIVIDKINNLVKQNDELSTIQNTKIEELCKKIEELEKSNNELKEVNNQNTNKIVKEARAIKKSILTILNTNFKDTPSINYIKEEEFRSELELEYKAKIADKDDKLFMRIFNDYEKKKLVKSLGDLILKFVKKEDQKIQPVFNIDSARGNYATKIEDCWFNDKNGLQLKKYTLDVIVGFMSNVMNIYRQKLILMYEKNKKEKNPSVIDYIMKYQSLLIDVNAFLTNSNVHKKIIIYMCPELRIDDNMLEMIK
jgi:hypothetical protein